MDCICGTSTLIPTSALGTGERDASFTLRDRTLSQGGADSRPVMHPMSRQHTGTATKKRGQGSACCGWGRLLEKRKFDQGLEG